MTQSNDTDFIDAEPVEPRPTDPCWVNVYLQDRAYGGPEEGGWWYDTNEVVMAIPTTYEHADEVVRRMEVDPRYSNEGRPPVSSILSEGRYAVYVEPCPGENGPASRPHYE